MDQARANLALFDRYEDNLRDIMQNFSTTPWKESLTEFEVFIGNILGDGHKQARRDRESSQEMRSRKTASLFTPYSNYRLTVIIQSTRN